MTVRRLVGVFAFVCMFSIVGLGQGTSVAVNTAPKQTEKKAKAPMTELKGIVLGMLGSDVKEKLGDPKVDDPDGFYYVLSDTESMQIRLDAEGKVTVLSMTFVGKKSVPPTVADVFGTADVAPVAPDERIHKVERYPSAGYWISYSRIMLDNGPMTTITIQKTR